MNAADAKSPRLDEQPSFWAERPKEDLVSRVAVLHKQRRLAAEQAKRTEVEVVRKAIAAFFVTGTGLEVGAGTRPFPLPAGTKCFYGDLRDGDELNEYFAGRDVNNEQVVDAQTFAGVEDGVFDFLIMAHVIEHLQNPVGSIRQAMRVLKEGGIFLLVAPDRRFTFDRFRPGTSIDHMLQDDQDGGESTRLGDYREFIEFAAVKVFGQNIAPEDFDAEARRLAEKSHDIHFHSWTGEEFGALLGAIASNLGFSVLGTTLNVNENIFVLRKDAAGA